MKYLLLPFILVSIKSLKGSKIIEEAASIANKVYTLDQLTSVVWWNPNINLVNSFLQKFYGTVVTVDIKLGTFNNSNFHETILYQQTVFFSEEPNEFEYFFECINSAIAMPIRVILILTNSQLYNMEAITKIAWEKDCTDLLILSNEDSGKIRLSSYKPYGPNKACGDYTPISLSTDLDITFMKKFAGFYKCPVRLTILDFMPFVELTKDNNTVTKIGGIDGNLLNLIMEKLNFSLDIVSSEDHGGMGSLINGTSVGSFSDLVYNKADIMIPSLVMNTIRYPMAQTSYVHYRVNMIWVLPKRREIYEWAKVALPFYNISTPLIVATIFLMFIMIKLVIRFATYKNVTQNEISFKLFGIFIGQSMQFRSQNFTINGLYIFWIWFSMVVSITYQGNLVEGLRKTILEPKITTLIDAVETVDNVGGAASIVEFYRNTTIEQKYKSVKISELPDYVNAIAAGKRFLLAIDTFQIQFYQKDVQILEQRISSVSACIHMRARWPAASQISTLISHIVEAGLYLKIREEVLFNLLLQNRVKDATDTLSPLRFKTLQSCFYGLIFMYIMCAVIMIIEIVWNRYSIYRNS